MSDSSNNLAAIKRRVSVRSYDDRVVEPHLLERLLAQANTADRVTDAPLHVALISGTEQTQRVLTYMLGSYGLVLTPPHVLVGVIPSQNAIARVEMGYVLEQVVLEASRLELGTCWIAGSYDAERAGNAVGLAPGEEAAAIIALGYPSRRGWGRVHTTTLRRLARGHKRKPLKDIVFLDRWGEPWSADSADPILTSILEHARLAPSAVNRQPWRFIVRSRDIVLALVRPKPIDAGIVMAHVAVAAEALGRKGQWYVSWRDAELAQACGLPRGITPVARFEGALV
jgi:nitroreductase